MERALVLADAGLTTKDWVQLAVEAEQAGFEAVYAMEAGRTSFVPLGAIATATSRVRLGSYAANAYARTPALTALGSLDLDELSDGRFTLCIAPGNHHINERLHGITMERPATKMAEYVSILRSMLAARAGETFSYDGRMHAVGGWTASKDGRPVPVMMAGTQPAMLRAAGRHADGVALGVLITPDYLREQILPVVHGAAAAADRDPASLRVLMAASTAVHEDKEAARYSVRRMICMLFSPLPHPYYEFLLREQGYGAVADAAARHVPAGEYDAAMAAIPDELADRLSVSGPVADCEKSIARYDGMVDEILFISAAGPARGSGETWADATRRLMPLAGA
ncbi:MAG: LLM class flavin-dependent oxidoreductase [Aeromicrobium sp.]